MKVLGFHLAWVTVRDMAASKKFFVEKLGMPVVVDTPEYNWLEISANGGARIGVGGEHSDSHLKAGHNAVISITVDQVDDALIAELQAKGIVVLGGIIEIPGHVRMILIQDESGNNYNLVQMLM